MFKAQCENPTKGDFSELVKEDLDKIGAKYDENMFQGYSKVQFKTFIKKHINNASFKYLNSLQIKHTKIQNIEYKEHKLQPYISESKLSNKMVSVLFSMRSSMTRGIRKIFSSMDFGKTICSLGNCFEEDDDATY